MTERQVNMIDRSLQTLRTELPRWEIWVSGLDDSKSVVTWHAQDPNFKENGIMVLAGDPIELVSRVRALVRVFDRASRVVLQPSTHPAPPAAPRKEPPPKAPPKPVPGPSQENALDPTALAPPKAQQIQAERSVLNYSGEQCDRCQQFAMVRTGKCTTCQNCGTTSGGCS